MRIITSGKRKRAVARAMITEGTGKVIYKDQDYKSLQMFDRLKLEEPVRIAEKVLGKINFDVKLTVKGGGDKGQIDAARLALAKAIVKFSNSKELAQIYIEYDRNLLVADIRRKEPNKPGDSKARSMRQSSKR